VDVRNDWITIWCERRRKEGGLIYQNQQSGEEVNNYVQKQGTNKDNERLSGLYVMRCDLIYSSDDIVCHIEASP
jgi:hypothetical protein